MPLQVPLFRQGEVERQNVLRSSGTNGGLVVNGLLVYGPRCLGNGMLEPDGTINNTVISNVHKHKLAMFDAASIFKLYHSLYHIRDLVWLSQVNRKSQMVYVKTLLIFIFHRNNKTYIFLFQDIEINLHKLCVIYLAK